MKLRLTLVAAILVVIVGVPAAILASGDGYVNGMSRRVDVWHDDARGVTCWIVSGTSGGSSVACLPDSTLTPQPQTVRK